MKVPHSPTTNVPPWIHAMRPICTARSGFNRQMPRPTLRRRRAFREKVQWRAELAAQETFSAHQLPVSM